MNSSNLLSVDKKRLFYGASLIVIALAAVLLRFRPTTVTTQWSVIKTTDVNAQILWQRSDPCLSTGYTTPHGAVAISHAQVAAHRSCVGTDGALLAFDLLTGGETWHSEANNGFQIVAVDDGYLAVFRDTTVRKIDPSGQTVWEAPEFVTRSMRAVFPQNDLIYAPFRTNNHAGIYIMSLQTGEIIQTIEDENIIGIFDEFRLRHTHHSTIEMVDVENESVIWSTPILTPNYMPSFTDIDKINDVLLFYTGRTRVDAYNIHTGEPLWSLEQAAGSYPFLIQNTLYIYGLDNTLKVYNPETGKMLGQVAFSRAGSLNSNSGRPESNVALAANDSIVTLMFRNTQELVTLQVDIIDR